LIQPAATPINLHATAGADMTEDNASKFCNFIDAHPRFFKKPKDWFLENWHVVEAFERQALRVIGANRTHYSARTIVEVLVHQSQVKEINGTYKIGNDNAPDLARVFVVLHPEHVDFWEYRRPDSIAFKGMFTQKDAL
jgi:hypothetical protein